MTLIVGTFEGREYRYRCAYCLVPMAFTVEGSFCVAHGLTGGFYLPISGEPEAITQEHRAALSTKKRKHREWRWTFGDLLEWAWLAPRASRADTGS